MSKFQVIKLNFRVIVEISTYVKISSFEVKISRYKVEISRY